MTRFSPGHTASLQLVLLFTAVTYGAPWREATETSLPTPRRSEDLRLPARLARPLFPHSIVPGGLVDADDVRVAMERDPLVAKHYRGVNLDELRPMTLMAGRAAYVSYRTGDQVYWTRNRVWLRAGETVLTDGTVTIRTRCGNCVSPTGQQPVAAVEPTTGALDDAVGSPDDRGVDAFASEVEPLGDLLNVPFGPQTVLGFAPGLVPSGPLLSDDQPFDPLSSVTYGARFPFFAGALPTSDTPPGENAATPPPPAPFVPIGDVPAPPGGTTTTGTPGGTTTGGPGGTTTGGGPSTTTGTTTTTGPTTTSGPTTTTGGSTTTGGPTTTGVVSTTGVTTGNVSTTGVSTTGLVTTGDATTGAPVPEPELSWLLMCAGLGLARRALTRRR